jgi:hypothetical protein
MIALVLLLAAGPDALVRTSVGAEKAWVGQRVALIVEVLVNGQFDGPTALDVPTPPGAIVYRPDDRPTVGTETVGDVTYTVQRHELAGYAQRPGAVTVPAFAVRCGSKEAFNKAHRDHRLTTKPVVYRAEMPPGAERLSSLLTTTSLKVEESWTPEPGAAVLGAAFKRTISVRAEGVPGLAIPPLPLEGEDGLRAYRGRPEVADAGDRGRLTGRRTESVTYVCERPGTYRLPGLVLAWWDPGTKELHRERLPDRSISVEPAASVAPQVPHGRSYWPIGLLLAAACAVAVWGAWPRPTEEARRFAEVARACQAGDPVQACRALAAWLDVLMAGSASEAARRLFAAGGPELREQWAVLDQAAYGRPSPVPWRGDRFWDTLVAARRTLHQGGRTSMTGGLAPLNPGSLHSHLER